MPKKLKTNKLGRARTETKLKKNQTKELHKENAKLDEALKETFPASDATAEY